MLKEKNKLYLRRLAHQNIKKINNYNIGKDKIDENVINLLKNAFNNSEIIKVTFLKTFLESVNKQEVILDLCSSLKAELIQSIGHTILLYKENKELDSHIKLPY